MLLLISTKLVNMSTLDDGKWIYIEEKRISPRSIHTMTVDTCSQKSSDQVKILDLTTVTIIKLMVSNTRWMIRCFLLILGAGIFVIGSYKDMNKFFTDDRKYQTTVYYGCVEQVPDRSMCSPICVGLTKTLDLNYWTYALCQQKTVSEEQCKKLKKLFNFDLGKTLAKSLPEFNSDYCTYQCHEERTRPYTYNELLGVIAETYVWFLIVMSYGVGLFL
ncbi:hypothetical protein Btru_065277 [Bulinus truncatus]|nr:hypothetical protein Btru_065277 [Bulinus truncatus]